MCTRDVIMCLEAALHQMIMVSFGVGQDNVKLI
jgi:hypothetical protein